MKVGDELAISPGFRVWDEEEFEEPPLCKGIVTRVSKTGATIQAYYLIKDKKWKWRPVGRPYVISSASEFKTRAGGRVRKKRGPRQP